MYRSFKNINKTNSRVAYNCVTKLTKIICVLLITFLQLNFVGVTVDTDRKYVHFPSSKHMFSPVPVGLETHPKQIYELYNGGAVPVQYQLDLTALHYVQEVRLPFLFKENIYGRFFNCVC